MAEPTTIGTIRRIQALMAYGYNEHTIAQEARVNTGTIAALALEANLLTTQWVAHAIDSTYRRLQLLHGGDWDAAKDARIRGWAVPFAWDEEEHDTEGNRSPHWIDDPDAYANWTGICGTAKGRHRHQTNDMPVCQPCKTAYSDHLYRQRNGRPNPKGKQRGTQTHCANGHERTPTNTRIKPDGSRECRICGRESEIKRADRRNERRRERRAEQRMTATAAS